MVVASLLPGVPGPSPYGAPRILGVVSGLIALKKIRDSFSPLTQEHYMTYGNDPGYNPGGNPQNQPGPQGGYPPPQGGYPRLRADIPRPRVATRRLPRGATRRAAVIRLRRAPTRPRPPVTSTAASTEISTEISTAASMAISTADTRLPSSRTGACASAPR
ncbi:hypothetical protein GCM10027612_39520 [Microbispora bryophytorum subsp. camponoti]